MNMSIKKLIRRISAGSLAAAAVVAVFVPLNMGGCGGTDLTNGIGGAVGGSLTHNPSPSPAVSTGGGSPLDIGNITNVGSFTNFGSGRVDYLQLAQGGFEMFQGSTLGENQERALGQEVALSATGRWNVVNDDALNNYVQMVAQTLADSTPQGGEPVAFVLDTNVPNAFSGPTGYIMVTRGLLAQLRDESELAGVMGHELGHIIKHHGLNSAKQAMITGGALKAGTSSLSRNALVGMGAPLADQIITSGYSQAQENEADKIAVGLSAAAGYDPQGYVRALQRLQPLQKGGNQAFSTHPDIADRINSVSREIAARKFAGGQTNQQRYQTIVLKQR